MDLLGGYSSSSEDEDIQSTKKSLVKEKLISSESSSKPIENSSVNNISIPVEKTFVVSEPSTSSEPKRKLPSAAALLKSLPKTHTYAGFSASNSNKEEVTVAPVGTRYNAVPVPAALVQKDDGADVRFKSTVWKSVAPSYLPQSVPLDKETAVNESKVLSLKPVQLKTNRSNVVTEDVGNWSRAKKAKKKENAQ